MSKERNYPKLRHPIDIRFETVENQQIILLSCPIGVSKSPLALVSAVAPILACFQGNMSAHEILDKFSSQGLTEDVLNQLINLLDDNLFLAGSRFFAAQQTMLEDFHNSSTRPAALAGRAYSAIPVELQGEIERYLNQNRLIDRVDRRQLHGLVSPHIDYRRGHLTYGKTYNILRDQNPDLYILIGTSHQYSRNIFHLSSKDFDSPLGILKCDLEFMSKLASLYGEKRSFDEEILHRQEHSLELQIPFIKHLKPNPMIAPILVGSFHNMLAAGKVPEEHEEYDRFAYSLTKCISDFKNSGRVPCLVAGVDMAHVGKYFGDNEALTPDKMSLIEERDRKYLDYICKQDKKSLFEHIAEDMDARRVCGFPTMYTVIDTFDRLGIKYQAELIEYRQAVDYNIDCGVTFAGVAIWV